MSKTNGFFYGDTKIKFKSEKERIQKILFTLPEIKKRIRNGGNWFDICSLCVPLGLVDTAFRDYPNLKDYLVSPTYWKNRLKKSKIYNRRMP